GQRAYVQIDRELAGKLAEHCETGVILFRHDRSQELLAVDLHDVGHLGGHHIVGATRLGFADQLGGGVEISLRRPAGAHLNEAGAEGRLLSGRSGHAVCPVAAGTASSGSSLPASSSAYRSSQPPTWVAPMKICGTVVRPLARSVIFARSARSPDTSISTNLT